MFFSTGAQHGNCPSVCSPCWGSEGKWLQISTTAKILSSEIPPVSGLNVALPTPLEPDTQGLENSAQYTVSLLKMLPLLHTSVRERVTTITFPLCMTVAGGSLCTLPMKWISKGSLAERGP